MVLFAAKASPRGPLRALAAASLGEESGFPSLKSHGQGPEVKGPMLPKEGG